MRTLSMAIALSGAALATATPAQAQRWSDPGFQAAANVTVHRDGPRHRGDGPRHRRDDVRHRLSKTFVGSPDHWPVDGHGRHGDGDLGYGWYGGGEWALYNNRSWEPVSYNDWWHERPDRAYPRWVMENRRGCDRGKWYSGDTLRC